MNLFVWGGGTHVLEFGCAKGESLRYLKKMGASELFGIDVSWEQIRIARNSELDSDKLFVGDMCGDYSIPKNYFDYVFSIYSIGYCDDLNKLFAKAYQYLKANGKFIISWTHPFFDCVDLNNNNNLVISKSYYDEDFRSIFKGECKAELVLKSNKISTLINLLIESGFKIKKIIEPDFVERNYAHKSNTYNLDKCLIIPSTIIIVAEK